MVRRIPDHGIKFHIIVVVSFPKRFTTGNLGNEVVGFVFDLIDKVLEIAGVHSCRAETYEGAACDALGHWGLANHKDVVGYGAVPQGLLVFQPLGRKHLLLHQGAIDGVGHV